MDRRDFLKTVAAGSLLGGPIEVLAAGPAPRAAPGRYDRLLVLIELKGGNDGLNTLVPYADPDYFALRPRIAIPRDQVLQLDEQAGLHPSLEPLMAMWRARELAIVQGVGYPNGNLSHFRSIEIWDTASRADEYLSDGWLTRLFATHPVPSRYAADGVVVGDSDMGPLGGGSGRSVSLANTEQFLRQARLVVPVAVGGTPALRHILRVEQDIVRAASGLHGNFAFRTAFPRTTFGLSVQTACQVAAARPGVAVVRVSLNGFDTHANQSGTHARLLRDIADGMVAFRQALTELGRWQSTLLMTYAEFGRRPRENQSAGTDHGTASVHLLAGGRVRGGLYGMPPGLDRLDGNGNLPFAIDFRELYATALERWWGLDARRVLGPGFRPLDLLRA